MEPDGGHEVVRHAKDQSPYEGRHTCGVHVAAKDGVREVRIAADRRGDEAAVADDLARRFEICEVHRVSRRGRIAQHRQRRGRHGAVARLGGAERVWSNHSFQPSNDPLT